MDHIAHNDNFLTTCFVLRLLDLDLILLAFITGNNSLEPLLEGVCAHIHVDLSRRGFGRNRTADLRITQFVSVPRSSPLS